MGRARTHTMIADGGSCSLVVVVVVGVVGVVDVRHALNTTAFIVFGPKRAI